MNELRRIGIHPDVVVCRSHEPLSSDIRDKIALFADVDRRAVVASPDVPDVYLIPAVLQEEGLDQLVCERLGIDRRRRRTSASGTSCSERIRGLGGETVRIALVGKYVKLHDAYLSVHEALKHAGLHHRCRVEVTWVDAEHMSYDEAARRSRRSTACSSRAASARAGGRKILARRVAREHGIPYLGICLGMHVAVSEFARHVAGLEGANSTEMDPETPYPVIDLLPEQKQVEDLGGRCGSARRRSSSRRDAGAGVLRRRGRPRAAPAPLRGEQPLPAAARGAGAHVSGTFQEAGSWRSWAAGPPVVRREPVPPGVQVPADGPAPLFRGFVRRRAARGAERRRGRALR